MVDREEDVDQDAQNGKLCRVTVNSKDRKTSNTSRVSSTTWVSIWCQLMALVVVLSGIIMTKSLGYAIFCLIIFVKCHCNICVKRHFNLCIYNNNNNNRIGVSRR